jgi:hypothetical protein
MGDYERGTHMTPRRADEATGPLDARAVRNDAKDD